LKRSGAQIESFQTPARRLIEAAVQASSALRRLRATALIEPERAKEECHLLERSHRNPANRRAVKGRIIDA
jgi:hypothetical protein